MKKFVRFIALAIAAVSAFSLIGCSHEHSFNTNEWEKNETMHWHASTCEHTDVMKDAEGHIDDDHDGDCDVCGYYDENHVHTYASDWTKDATGHWKVSTCFHDTIDEFAAHTPDTFGVCTECGYNAGVDVSTVAKALTLAGTQQSLVNAGKVYKDTTGAYSERGYFEVGENYCHTVNYYGSNSMEEFWYATVNGKIVAFTKSGSSYEYHNYDIEPQQVNGWYFDGNEVANVNKFYGIYDYINGVYNLAKSSHPLQSTFVESVNDGVYSFSYDYYSTDSSDDYFTITVNFTLGSEYTLAKAELKSERWYYAEDGDDEDSIPEKPATDPDQVVTYTLSQYVTEPETPYFDIVGKFVSSFDLYDEDVKVTDTINLVAGTQKTLTLGDMMPEGVTLDYEAFSYEGVDASNNSPISIQMLSGNYIIMFAKSSKQLKLNFKVAGTYIVTINSRVSSKTYTVVVSPAQTTSLNFTVNGTTVTTANCYTGSEFAFDTVANQYADGASTIEFVSVPTGSALTNFDIVANPTTGMNLFTPDVDGEYVIKATSISNPEVEATLTVTAVALPTIADILKGTWTNNSDNMAGNVTVTITPDATAVGDALYSGTINIVADGMMGGNETSTYTYDETNGFVWAGETQYKWYVAFDADTLTLYAMYNNATKQLILTAVKEPDPIEIPDLSEVFAATYSDNSDNMAGTVTVTFTPDATPVDGAVYSGSATIVANGGHMNGNETATYTVDAINGFVWGGQTTGKWYVKIDLETLTVYGAYNDGGKVLALTKGEVEQKTTADILVETGYWNADDYYIHFTEEAGVITMVLMNNTKYPSADWALAYTLTSVDEPDFMGLEKLNLTVNTDLTKGNAPVAINFDAGVYYCAQDVDVEIMFGESDWTYFTAYLGAI